MFWGVSELYYFYYYSFYLIVWLLVKLSRVSSTTVALGASDYWDKYCHRQIIKVASSVSIVLLYYFYLGAYTRLSGSV
jgi:hypothetical protein